VSGAAEAEARAADPREALRTAVLADPAAVLEDADLVRALLAAHPAEAPAGARKVVDLRGALLDRLESRLSRLEETHRTVVAAAWENLAGAQSIHRAALAVLEPTAFSGVLRALSAEIPGILGVEAVRLALETEGGAEIDPPLVALAPGEAAALLAPGREADGPERSVALRPIGPDSARLFGSVTPILGSEALVRLDFGPRARPGLLAFGAREADRFTPDQAGDLLEFFGGVVARAVRRWVAGG
jgi:uncharacterized protein YigA (DUF484 family)